MKHTLRRLQGAAETPAWAPDQPGTAEGAGIAAAAGTGIAAAAGRAARRPGSPEKESAR